MTSTRHARFPLAALVVLVALLVAAPAATAATSPVTKRGVSDTVLASEFLRLLEAKSTVGLKRFLSPAFLLQRPDGTFLTRDGYLKNPAVVESFKVSKVKGTKTQNVRVIRYTVVTKSMIDGKQVTNDPVARLSTYLYDDKQWTLVAHANFTAVPK